MNTGSSFVVVELMARCVGGRVAAASKTKSKSKSKSKTGTKAATKATTKATTKAVAKTAPKASSKAAAKVAKKATPAVKAEKKKSPAKAVAKPAVKAKGKATEKAALQKTEEKKSTASKASESVSDSVKGDEIEAPVQEGDVQVEEALSPSAALLRSMKPTSNADKQGDRKKKKDDLKLDRGGDLEAQWAQIKEKYKALKPVAYKMSEVFEARTPIIHKVLGWGFIISNQNDRLEVLFQQGIKNLISNYKA